MMIHISFHQKARFFITVWVGVLTFLILWADLPAAAGSYPPSSVLLEAQPAGDKALKERNETYRFGIGDKLDITVFGEENLSKVYTVNDQGMISVPLIGDVRTAGLDIQQLEQRLENRFREGYLVNPSISVELVQARPFFIMGEVLSPGDYEYKTGLTIIKAIALAGGYTYRAKKDEVTIIRQQDDTTVELKNVPVHTGLRPGDIIKVKERFF